MWSHTSRDLLSAAARRLRASGIDSARLDVRVLLAHALRKPSDQIFGIDHLNDEQARAFEVLIARRAAREPLAYITGVREFFGLDFEVGSGVLIPRPESETLIEEALHAFPDRGAALEVLDLGTGSGCLLVAFLKQYANARGVGVEKSADALVWAARNVARHGLSGRCVLRHEEWNAEGMFDVLFSNPPYLTEEECALAAPEIRRFEPRLALTGGCDGLAAYRDFAPVVARALKPQGVAFVEIGAGQAHVVKGILERSGLEVRSVAPDLAGVLRCVIAGRRP